MKKCLECGSLDVEGHHEDYSKPLEVICCCSKHHKKIQKDFKGK